MRLLIRVVEVKGTCPVYQVGDRFTIRDGNVLDPREMDPVCMHSLASLMPYYVALGRGVPARDLGLARAGSEAAYLQCLDPCQITGGGTVIMEVTRVED